MYIILKTEELGNEAEEIKKFIEYELGSDITEKNGNLTVVDDTGTFTQTELFKLGMGYGKQQEKAHWNKPESIFLHGEYVDMFREAIAKYSEKSYIRVDSITIGEAPQEDKWRGTEITIRPTHAISLIGIAEEFGKLCYKFEQEEARKTLK